MMNKYLVSNTGPMIALSGIGELEILKKLFNEVMIPHAVYNELITGYSDTESGRESFKIPEWISIVKLSKEPDPLLVQMLDPGEAAVIELASLDTERIILMDEKKGRKIAGDIYGLPVTGTAGLLILAKRAGLINAASSLIISMRNNGYWIDEAILNFVMRETKE